MTDLARIFPRIPLLQGQHPQDFRIRALPGQTNDNYLLSNTDTQWILRVPRQRTNAFIDRSAEAINSEYAQQLQLAPATIWRDQGGLSLTELLSDCYSPNAEQILQADTLNTLLSRLRKLHRSHQRFVGETDLPLLLITYYEALRAGHKIRLRRDYQQALNVAERLSQQDQQRVPSHNDLVLENILLNPQGECWFIDWEYAAMSSPYWDLATLCNAAQLDQPQSYQLLVVYAASDNLLDISMLMDYRFVLEVLANCWTCAIADRS